MSATFDGAKSVPGLDEYDCIVPVPGMAAVAVAPKGSGRNGPGGTKVLDARNVRCTVDAVEPFDAMFSEDPAFAVRLGQLARGWDGSSEVASTVDRLCRTRRLVHTCTVTFDRFTAEAVFDVGNCNVICEGALRHHGRELAAVAAGEGVELRLCELAPRAGGWALSATAALVGNPIPHRRIEVDCRRLTLVY